MRVGAFVYPRKVVSVVLFFVVSLLFLVSIPAFSQQADVTPLQLVDFDFTPKAIDARYGPQDVEITVHTRDDLTGVDWVDAGFRSPSGEHGSGDSNAELVSGIPNDGIWRWIITFPQYSESGTWRVSEACLADRGSPNTNEERFDTNDLKASGSTVFLRYNPEFNSIFPYLIVIFTAFAEENGQCPSEWTNAVCLKGGKATN